MPSYNLTQNQRGILITWLYEPSGYLEAAVDDSGLSARNALLADPNLDVTQWIRSHSPGPSTYIGDWVECGMVWWILANDQVNIQPPNRPPETASWTSILHEWDDSINAGFARVPQNERDNNATQLYDESGLPSGTMPSGASLAQQQQIITKVLGVLE